MVDRIREGEVMGGKTLEGINKKGGRIGIIREKGTKDWDGRTERKR